MTRDEWIVIGLVVLILVGVGMFMAVAQGRAAQKVMTVACMNSQNIIASAIHSAMLENNWTNGETVQIEKVTPFLRDGKLPQCHRGGQYIIGKVGDWPKCTVHGPLRMELPNQASHATSETAPSAASSAHEG